MVNIEKIEYRIWDKGKLISKHKSFWLACLAVDRKLKKGKISKEYAIEMVIIKEK